MESCIYLHRQTETNRHTDTRMHAHTHALTHTPDRPFECSDLDICQITCITEADGADDNAMTCNVRPGIIDPQLHMHTGCQVMGRS